MPQFSKRRINQQTLNIIRYTGRVIACYQQISGFPDPSVRIPTDPYAAAAGEPDADYKKYFIFASFKQTTGESTAIEGQVTAVTGTLVVPRMYVDVLRVTAYFDPYCNGSKFIKVGAVVDEENIVVEQAIKSIYLPNQGVE